MARVEDLIRGAEDGLIRGAVVKVMMKNRSMLLRRPLQHLYPLEVRSEIELDTEGKSTNVPPGAEANTIVSR